MRRPAAGFARVLAAAALLAAAAPARAFLGFGDTSFVTVIANPAEAANWAAELERLNSQLEAARQTLQTVGDLRAYAGDPGAAVAALRDLSGITAALGSLSSGGQTDADLLRAWETLGSAERLIDAAALLGRTGAGAAMQVFGGARQRDLALYAAFAKEADSSQQIRGQVADEQQARAAVASELALAWSRFRAASTESSKQAILAEISQLQSQNQVMDTRRRALLDDLALSDRQERTQARVRETASDEESLAESALLNAAVDGRAQGAEAQRLATLRKPAAPAPQYDYSGVKLWTTADAGGASN